MANAISRLIKRFGQELSEEMRSLISGLPLPVIENLSEALLDFTSVAEIHKLGCQRSGSNSPVIGLNRVV